jgi:ubiquinone/menaquinone biosynthesis C-methylase UbiE
MHGFVCVRRHGYPGDFEIIDRIYQRHVAAEPEYAGWDHFFHAGDAAKAVRARKSYCVNLFNSHAERSHGDVDILNVASGPCRDVLEFKAQETEAAQRTAVHCIDSDSNAIAHARQLLQRYIGDITFEERNVLRMRTTRDFDLVWSAGLFDYFDDRVFVSVLKKLYSALRTGGELVVGNFSTRLKSKSYMEFGEWRLNYRDEETIWRLARTAGFADEQISIDSEETGSNLFLHVRK